MLWILLGVSEKDVLTQDFFLRATLVTPVQFTVNGVRIPFSQTKKAFKF